MNVATMLAPGAATTSTGTAVLLAIPLDSSGGRPRFIRVSATASAYVQTGGSDAAAVVGDVMIQPGDSAFLSVIGCSYLSVKSVSGSAKVQVHATEHGRWDYTYAATGFTPLTLFAAGEQGAWYDPSDFSSMYQDSVGTTPVTAVGQPVGLMLDKRLGSVRGVELIGDSGFSTPGYWSTTNAGWSVAGGVGTASALPDAQSLYRPGLLTVGKTYAVQFEIVSITSGAVYPSIGGNSLSTPFSTVGIKTCILTATANTNANLISAGLTNCVVDNFSVKELPGNHASQPTAINRPVLQQDGAGKFYLAFNGTNSWMQTGSIDFTATDKMTVAAGVRKLTDSGFGGLAEHGANTDTLGSFAVLAANGLGYYGQCGVTGNRSLLLTTGGAASPRSDVVALLLDRSKADVSEMTYKINGAAATSAGVSIEGAAGAAGNFGNYPLYIGARAGSSLFLNGSIYSLIVRGALSSNAQITSAEAYANSKTGAY